MHTDELLELYDEAIKVCEEWRNQRPITKATPTELHVYNVFTRAQNSLSEELAVIEDTLGVYMKRGKK